MIQRKQSLFLLIVFILSGISIFIPFQKLTISPENVLSINLMPGLSEVNSTICIPMALDLLVVVLSVFIIFQFKNRVLQYKLSNLLALLNVVIVGLFFLLPFVKDGIAGTINFSIGAFLPILSMISAFLAAHFVKKDEQLVRSADRIR